MKLLSKKGMMAAGALALLALTATQPAMAQQLGDVLTNIDKGNTSQAKSFLLSFATVFGVIMLIIFPFALKKSISDSERNPYKVPVALLLAGVLFISVGQYASIAKTTTFGGGTPSAVTF